MSNDTTTDDAMDPRKDRLRKKAIDNPLFTPSVQEEPESEEVEDNVTPEIVAVEEKPQAPRAIAPASEVRRRVQETPPAVPPARPRPLEAERVKAAEPDRPAVEKKTEAPRSIAPVPDARLRDLEKQNAALLAQIRQLELDRVRHETEEAQEQLDDFQDASEESRSIIQIVESLERQLDESFALRDALSADLEKARTKLSSEMVARRGLEERLKLCEAEAALVDPLRDELTFIEQERSEIARNLKTTADLLEQTTNERDALTEKMEAAQDRIGELEGLKIDLEAQVMDLQERLYEFGEVRKTLAERNAQCEDLTRRLRDMTVRLDATETSKKALELDLATNKRIAVDLREELKALNQKVAYMETESLDLRERLEEQQVENVDLRVRNKRVEHDLKSEVAKHKTTTAELESSQKALRDVRTATSRTGKRIESRYSAIHTNTDSEETPLQVEE